MQKALNDIHARVTAGEFAGDDDGVVEELGRVLRACGPGVSLAAPEPPSVEQLDASLHALLKVCGILFS